MLLLSNSAFIRHQPEDYKARYTNCGDRGSSLSFSIASSISIIFAALSGDFAFFLNLSSSLFAHPFEAQNLSRCEAIPDFFLNAISYCPKF